MKTKINLMMPVRWVKVKCNDEYEYELKAINSFGLIDIYAVISKCDKKFHADVLFVNNLEFLFSTLREAQESIENYYHIEKTYDKQIMPPSLTPLEEMAKEIAEKIREEFKKTTPKPKRNQIIKEAAKQLKAEIRKTKVK